MLYTKNYLEVVLSRKNSLEDLLLILNDEIKHLINDLKYSFDAEIRISNLKYVSVDDMEFSSSEDLKENLKEAILFLEEENFEKEVG